MLPTSRKLTRNRRVSSAVWSTSALLAAAVISAALPRVSLAEDPAPTTAAPADNGAAAPAPADNAAAPADGGAAAPAPAAGGDAASAPAASQPSALANLADDFLHYSLVGRVDLAHDSGQAILNQNPDPKELLTTFESVANGRDIESILIRNQQTPQLRDVSVKILNTLEAGHRAVARDPQRIKDEIDRLANGPRAYVNARVRLQAAGEFAVPYFVAALQDQNKANLDPYIIQMMIDVGRPLLPALLESLKLPDQTFKVQLVNVIGQIGYPEALPYLKQIEQDPNTIPELKKAAGTAIAQIDPSGKVGGQPAADLYLDLASGFFNQKPSLAPSHPNEETNPVWVFNKTLNNVEYVPVPTAIWWDVQSMRSSENALALKGNLAPAISVWLAANLRRETHLANGQTDPLHKDAPDAHYFAVAAGPEYLNPVLAMALSHHDVPLALKTITALEETSGNDAIASGTLVSAMLYPDKSVRIPAALAIARSNPTKPFAGSYRVVPVLAEAVSQTGKPVAILVGDVSNNAIKDALRDKYTFFESPTLSQTLDQAKQAAAIDLVVVQNGPESQHLQQMANDPRLMNVPTLVVYDPSNAATPTQIQAAFNQSPTVMPVASNADTATIQEDAQKVRGTQANQLDDKTASGYSLEAANLVFIGNPISERLFLEALCSRLPGS